MWFLYVVLCDDGTLYTGITKDVLKRVACHNTGAGAKYTRSRRPVELLAKCEICDSRSVALRCEYAFKRLSKKQKLANVQVGLQQFVKDQRMRMNH